MSNNGSGNTRVNGGNVPRNNGSGNVPPRNNGSGNGARVNGGNVRNNSGNTPGCNRAAMRAEIVREIQNQTTKIVSALKNAKNVPGGPPTNKLPNM